MRPSSNHLCTYIFLFFLLGCSADLTGCAASNDPNKSEDKSKSVSISVGDKVLCISLYENLEDPGHGPSHRTVTEIVGIVQEVGESEYHLIVQEVGLSRFRLKNGKWIYDASLLRGPQVRKGDVFVCHPESEKQRRSGSEVRQQVTIEKLSSHKENK